MKLLLGLLVSLAISSAFALPARPKDEVDIIEVPQGPQRSRESDAGANDDDSDVDPDFRNFKGVVDTGAGYPFLAPLPQPFSFNLGFFDSFEDIFRRLRTRLWSEGGSGESSEEGGLSLGLDPTKGANTTSVVKVVDGHKIEINDTVYGNGDGSNGAVFKFRVINIRPLESGEVVPEAETEESQDPSTTPQEQDIEGKTNRNNEESGEEVKPDDNEINANIDDPESTTEAITTEMHDTVPHRIPESDNNAVDNDSPVNQDELQEDDNMVTTTTTEGYEPLDDGVISLDEDETNPDANTIKSEKLSALDDAKNVNDASEEDIEQSNKDDGEFNESNGENQNSEAYDELLEQQHELQEVLAGQQIQELVDTVGEKLSMANEEEERFADEVERMLSTNEQSQKPGRHSLREDLSSSDDDEDDEDVNDVEYQGLNSEWGGSAVQDDKNILTNEIDVYESVPIDLSNDIAINDIMAAQGAAADPDAEVFSVDEFAPSAGEFMAGRRFEVLRDIK